MRQSLLVCFRKLQTHILTSSVHQRNYSHPDSRITMVSVPCHLMLRRFQRVSITARVKDLPLATTCFRPALHGNTYIHRHSRVHVFMDHPNHSVCIFGRPWPKANVRCVSVASTCPKSFGVRQFPRLPRNHPIATLPSAEAHIVCCCCCCCCYRYCVMDERPHDHRQDPHGDRTYEVVCRWSRPSACIEV